MFEGTSKYFYLLFLIFFIVYLTVKIVLSKLFKGAKVAGWKAFIPFYNRLVLINLLDMKKSIFYKTLIPFGNLYYYNIIIKELLKAYQLDPNESIWFVIFPMYKFPELLYKNPRFMLHMYDETEEFIENQNVLFNQPVEEKTIISPENYEQTNVFTDESLKPDERKETVVEAKEEVVKEDKPIVINTSGTKVCPKCGTKLSADASVCFLCGTKV